MLKEYIEILSRNMNLPVEKIDPGLCIGNYCNMIDLAELIVELESEFGIEIHDEKIECGAVTVGELWAYIKEAQQGS